MYTTTPWLDQHYRTELLYEGPHDDRYVRVMKKCDPDGPLTMYICLSWFPPLMVHASMPLVVFIFWGGKISTDKKCRIMGQIKRSSILTFLLCRKYSRARSKLI